MADTFMTPPGGLSNKKLALADATANDVLSGKKFYAGDKTLKTGTFTMKLVAINNIFVNGKTASSRSTSFTVQRNGFGFISIVMGLPKNGNKSVSCTCGGRSVSLNSRTATSTIDSYHDNEAVGYSGIFTCSAGETVKVDWSVLSNINDCTAYAFFYN